MPPLILLVSNLFLSFFYIDNLIFMYKYNVFPYCIRQHLGGYCQMTCVLLGYTGFLIIKMFRYCITCALVELGTCILRRWYGGNAGISCDTYASLWFWSFSTPSNIHFAPTALYICPFPQWQTAAGTDSTIFLRRILLDLRFVHTPSHIGIMKR